MRHKSTANHLFNGINALLLAAVALVMMVPFLYVFTISFSTYKEFLQSEFMLFPKTWVTTAYAYILNSKPFIRSIGVTIELTVIGTIVNLLFTSTLAYMLSRQVVAQRTLMFLVVFTLLFSAGMIPTYLVVKETGLLNSIWALIIPVAISPYYLIVMRQFFLSIPTEITEAAVIDGANDLSVFARIILPLSKPALAAFGLFYAVAHWNNYFTGLLYLNNSEAWPIQVVLRQIVVVGEPQASLEMATAYAPPAETIQMAAIVLATVPILLLYPFLQKHFAKGVMLGSVKG